MDKKLSIMIKQKFIVMDKSLSIMIKRRIYCND